MIDSASHQTSWILVTIQTAALRICATKPYRYSYLYIQINIPVTPSCSLVRKITTQTYLYRLHNILHTNQTAYALQ